MVLGLWGPAPFVCPLNRYVGSIWASVFAILLEQPRPYPALRKLKMSRI
jgi:hypothetical protein